MKIVLLVYLLFSVCIQCLAQNVTRGENADPQKRMIGVKPYEMKSSTRKPTLDFLDCQKWLVESAGCTAQLYKSRDQIVASNFSGKLVYQALQKNGVSIFLKLSKPLKLDSTWDCMDLWSYGDQWAWVSGSRTSLDMYAVFINNDNGEKQNIYLSKLNYVYWFLNHTRINVSNLTFLGLLFQSKVSDLNISRTIYLNDIYFYKESVNKLTFRSFPKVLPFPKRKETLLPTVTNKDYKNRIVNEGSFYRFEYSGTDDSFSYELSSNNILGDLSLYKGNKKVYTLSGRQLIGDDGNNVLLTVKDHALKSDTLFFTCLTEYHNKQKSFRIWYTIRQKSLIMSIKELDHDGFIREMNSGTILYNQGQVVDVPFLKYNYNGSQRPSIFYTDGVFTSLMFDWYTTNASKWETKLPSNGFFVGDNAIYNPKTDGTRNTLNEKLFINVSSNVEEVFPNISNPVSPVKNLYADRLYMVAAGSDLKSLEKTFEDYRAKGLDRIFARSHEEFWRQEGESFTFRLKPNPKIGVKGVKNFVSFLHQLGWKFSLYTNYSDFAPVNSNWNPDWVIRSSDDNWEGAWTRCYAAKPQVAWEQEAILAPQISKIYGTDFSYCDVMTAVSPMDRVDYDARLDGAGMMRSTYERYGALLMNERKAYDGPVFSEGGSHWWYAGLVDGNYANDDLVHLPVFPDFSLLKIHPLEMDFATVGNGYQYLSYALAYGNIGMLSFNNEDFKRYAMLQPIQKNYVASTVSSIKYCDNNKEYCSSEAIKRGLLNTPSLHIIYQSGLEMYINFNIVNWKVAIGKNVYTLPQYGFVVYNPSTSLRSESVISSETGVRCDQVNSPYLFYIDSHGKQVSGNLGGKGNYMLKKDNGCWYIIPLEANTTFRFNLSSLKLSSKIVKVDCLDRNGKNLGKSIGIFRNRVEFTALPSVFKYKISILGNLSPNQK